MGILLATYTTSMGQFGLLVIPVLVILQMLSGSAAPMETMPIWLQDAMQIFPRRISSASPRPFFIGRPASTSSGPNSS